MNHDFSSDFVWGAAASAYQTEGAVHEGGRGESIWDRFCATPGKVRAGATGEIACDFYHRYPEDIALMGELGIDAFRFSIAWPRIVPAATGPANQAGLDFYDRLVDALLEAGIRPFVNLFHWDLPQVLEDAGGWPERATAEAFAGYAAVVAARLGDRVKDWITHNEPFCTSWLGYGLGAHAPGRTSVRDALAASHHALLAHGWAVEAVRRASPGAEIGIVVDPWPIHPASEDPADVAAAWAEDGVRNRWFFDPLLRGAYPEDVLERFAADAPPVRDGDLATISVPLDFVGVNNYSRRVVRAGLNGAAIDMPAPGGEVTDMGWEVYPDGLHESLVRMHREYGVESIYVTENGAAFADVRTHDGEIHDVERIAYLDGYLDAVGSAIADGVPVRGYFVWSLLDNFEWSLGYSKRFGLVYVDYPTLERVPKDSFYWYRDLIGSGRLERRSVAAG
ncbi:MAG TPA: GH1 family beta-glucosidase [Gaiellaceae bacterium]|nr:GH1 family beta-glucosidase [Gaiellaceae bacterium]